MLVIEAPDEADIRIDERWIKYAKGKICVRGPSKLVMERPSHVGPYTTINIILQEGELIIGQQCFVKKLTATVRQSTLRIGAATRIQSLSVSQNEPSVVTIGENCLFGPCISLITSDSHSVISVATGERLNPPRDIVVGDRVWFASEAMVMKGSRIGDGSVIGARALVCGSIPSNVVAVGVPAKPVKHGVTWDSDLLPYAGDEQMEASGVILQPQEDCLATVPPIL